MKVEKLACRNFIYLTYFTLTQRLASKNFKRKNDVNLGMVQ